MSDQNRYYELMSQACRANATACARSAEATRVHPWMSDEEKAASAADYERMERSYLDSAAKWMEMVTP